MTQTRTLTLTGLTQSVERQKPAYISYRGEGWNLGDNLVLLALMALDCRIKVSINQRKGRDYFAWVDSDRCGVIFLEAM